MTHILWFWYLDGYLRIENPISKQFIKITQLRICLITQNLKNMQ